MTSTPSPRRKAPKLKSGREADESGNSKSPGSTEPDNEASGDESLEKSLEALDALETEQKTEQRVRRMPHDVAWLLITAGMVGLVTPGVLGLPFLAMGGLVLWPGNSKLLERWLTDQPPRLMKGSMKQIGRFLDDLERRYP